MEYTKNQWENPDAPASMYKSEVVRVEEHPESNSVNVFHQVNGETTERVATFFNNGEVIGTRFENIKALNVGQIIQLQNEPLSNVPGKIWIIKSE